MVTGNIEMRHLTAAAAHRSEVEAVIMAAADYNLLIEGVAPSALHVDDFFMSLPPGSQPSDKFIVGFYDSSVIVGIAEVVRGWNAPYKAIIGLLLLTPAARGGGRGRLALDAIETLARSWTGVTTLRIAVIDNNIAAFAFWRRMGFDETGERRPVEAPYLGAKVVLEKNI